MSEEQSREHFEAYYSIHLNDENVVSKEIAWTIWEKSRIITEIYLKG